MASKKHRPEEAVAKLRQVDVLVSQGQSVAEGTCSSPMLVGARREASTKRLT
jgi:hypothetical protein